MSVAFTPIEAATVKIAVTAASGNVAIVTSGRSLLLSNAGTKVCFVRRGTSSAAVALSEADTPVLPGRELLISKTPKVTYIAAICAGSDSTTLYITPGDGVYT